MDSLRPQHELAEEIGQRVIDAADRLIMFTPDLEAKITFDLDDTAFEIRLRVSGGAA